MRICLIIDDYLPRSTKVGAKMMHDLALEFLSRGYVVSVITPDSTIDQNYEIGRLDGVEVYRFKTGEIKNAGKFKRAINETLLSIRALFFMRSELKKRPHDLIVYYSPSIFWGLLVFALKKKWKAKSYLVLRDFFPQWVIDNGMLNPRSPITLYFRIIEKISYLAADKIGVQSKANVDVFSSIYKSDAVEVLYNWSSNKEPVLQSNYRDAFGLQDKVVFFYGGNIGAAQNMMNVVRLAKRMQAEEAAHFLLVGSGDEVELIKSAIKKEGISNLTLLAPVPQDEYFSMLSEFDVGLFSLHRNHTAHNFPGKLLGYMERSLPILGSVNDGNDVQSVLVDSGAGLVSINGDDETFYENARTMCREPGLRRNIGSKAFSLLESQFSVGAAADGILSD